MGHWRFRLAVQKQDGTCVIENSFFESPTNWSLQGDILITKDMSGAMGQQEYGLTNIQKDSFKMNVRGKYSVDARRIEWDADSLKSGLESPSKRLQYQAAMPRPR